MPTDLIQLGDTVRDVISGIEGIAVARTSYLSGCDRISIQPFGSKDGEAFKWHTCDVLQVEIVPGKERIVLVKVEPPTSTKSPAIGGPRPEPDRR